MKHLGTRERSLSGMLVVNKPAGMVSKDVSRWLEKRLGKIKMGHVGTLDPLAEGVLPILLGKATRLQDYLLGGIKIYEFDVLFGKATDSMDAAGEVIATMSWEHISTEALKEIAAAMEGEIAQTPPVYSAIKYKGRALYEYARSGREEEVPLEDLSRRVMIHRLSLLRHEGNTATFETVCSKGTYVRSLAAKIGENAGSCGMVTRLVRKTTSGVSLADALTLHQIEECGEALEKLLIPISKLQLGLPRWKADENAVHRLLTGQRVKLGRGQFASGVVSAPSTEMSSEAEWILVDQADDAFGIGIVRSLDQDFLVVTLKRGLL